MPIVNMRVVLLERTQNALGLIYAACRQCYSDKFAGDILEDCRDDIRKQEEFVRRVVASGHESPLEHVKFTFGVDGVSRALTHQLVRHRVASYSQQSQRYVKEDDFDFILPPQVARYPAAREIFLKTMQDIRESYAGLLRVFEENGITGEKANQDARFVLPQAAETKIVVTMNCRELIHFFHHRCCTRAQWEIRALAQAMLEICRKEIPSVFAEAGAKCELTKRCPEGEKFCCGRYPPA